MNELHDPVIGKSLKIIPKVRIGGDQSCDIKRLKCGKVTGGSSSPLGSPTRRVATSSPTFEEERSVAFTSPGEGECLQLHNMIGRMQGGVRWKLPIVIGRSAIRTFKSDVTGRNSTELLMTEEEHSIARRPSLSVKTGSRIEET
eukprot:751314-Hanusia_phi.AAC.3